MTPVERVRRVLEGKRPDRPPVSFWHHFPADQVCGPSAVAAHVAHLDDYDLDFLKIMNDNGYPHAGRVESAADHADLRAFDGDEPEFVRQLDLIADLRRALGDRVLMATTLFNAWATLRRLVRGMPTVHNPPNLNAAKDDASRTLRGYFESDPDAMRRAIDTIGTNLANFAGRCIAAGADGVFLSVRDDWLQTGNSSDRLYDELVRPSDLRILDAASGGTFNLLHVCGTPIDLRAFAQYPVHVINWADRAAGPAIGDVIGWCKPVICGGVDNQRTLPEGTPEDCAAEVADTLAQAGSRPIMIGLGCTYDPARVPRENLEAVCRAARG